MWNCVQIFKTCYGQFDFEKYQDKIIFELEFLMHFSFIFTPRFTTLKPNGVVIIKAGNKCDLSTRR